MAQQAPCLLPLQRRLRDPRTSSHQHDERDVMRKWIEVCLLGRSFAQAVLLVAAVATSANAATIDVLAGGNLQAAINAAQQGDTIRLAAGATFTGNFVLPVHAGTGYITIRS